MKDRKTFTPAAAAVSIALVIAAAAGCRITLVPEIVEAPPEVREAAFAEAGKYIGMEYEWGGQDFYARGVDCSGLVVNAYLRAARAFGYRMLFTDSTAREMHERYTAPVGTPATGDLIFMGYGGEVSHVAVFERFEAGEVWFIDANSESGFVERRRYAANDPKIISFGRMLLSPK